MVRGLVLAALLVVGTLSMSVSGAQAPPAGPSAAALAATKIEKVKDNLYIITGSGAGDQSAFSGGNSAVFVTDAGVTIVDTKLPGWGQVLVDRIKTVTNKPITRIINTHTHADHTGGNEFFGTMVESVVQENAKASMAKSNEFTGDKAKFLPGRTYKDRLTLGTGRDRIDLYYFGRAHTNGDTFVVFPALRTMHVGDVFAWKALPLVDAANGGSVTEYPTTLARVVETVKDVDTIVNGHIPVSTWNDLREYAAFTKEFTDWARAQMNAGKTAAQAAAEYKVPEKYKGYVVTPNPAFGGVRGVLDIAYGEMKR